MNIYWKPAKNSTLLFQLDTGT